jgi:hypothetical protein
VRAGCGTSRTSLPAGAALGRSFSSRLIRSYTSTPRIDLDAIGVLIASPQDYQQAAHAILNSSVGLAQYRHRGGGGPEKEFRRILHAKKDVLANVEKSIAWLQTQDDYSGNCTLYENRYIGYNVKSQSFQQASRFLWDHYSL